MANFRFSDLLPDHFKESEEIVALFDVIQQLVEEEFIPKVDQLSTLHNPDKFPFELVEGYKEMVDFNVPQIFPQGEEEIRRQLKFLPDVIRTKGREVAVRSYMASLGFTSETEVMLSTDYATFTPDSEVFDEFGIIPDNYFYTPHVELRFTPFNLLDGRFLTPELFEIIQNRVLQLSPLTTVYRWRLQIKAIAEEDHVVRQLHHVSGTTTNKFQPVNSEFFGQCHEATDEDHAVQALRTFEFMDTEFIDHWKIGTYSGTVSSSISGTQELNTVLKESSEFTLEPRPDLDLSRITLPVEDQQLIGSEYSALAFYDEFDQMMALFKFPPFEIFDIEDLNVEFVVDFEESEPELRRSEITEYPSSDDYVDEMAGLPSGTRGFLLDDYYMGWDHDHTLQWPFVFDAGLELDSTDKLPFLVVVDEGSLLDFEERGFWRAGTLPNGTDLDELQVQEINGLPELVNPLTENCFDFEIRNLDGTRQWLFSADLVQEDHFGFELSQFGIYDQNEHLIAVFQFPPVFIEDQFSRAKFELILNNQF